MLEFHELKELISLFDNSSLSFCKLEQDGTKLVLEKKVEAAKIITPPQQIIENPKQIEETTISSPPVVLPKEEEALLTITSPVVGTFYSSPSPEQSPYVNAGDTVQKGQTICIVEAMKLFNEIDSDYEGVIAEVLVKNGEVVEYGQPLFRIRPN